MTQGASDSKIYGMPGRKITEVVFPDNQISGIKGCSPPTILVNSSGNRGPIVGGSLPT